MTLAGQVVLVTGGSRGIGKACVLRAAAAGARVAFCSRGDDRTQAVEAEAAALAEPGCAFGVRADVSQEFDVERLFDLVLSRFGRLDAVVHNAAISRESLLVSTAPEDLEKVLATNLTGSFLIARQALGIFLERNRDGGRVVFIGTLSQNGAAGNAGYAASKGGVEGLMRTIARQYSGRSIRANMVVSGYVQTDLSASLSESARRSLIDGCPLRRSASAEEVAALAIHLISDASRGIDGESVFATGGLLEVPS